MYTQLLRLALVWFTVISSSVSGWRKGKGRRIFGGSTVNIADYPYQVALFSNLLPHLNEGQICGGSIIADNYVLTAAHCFNSRNAYAIYAIKYGIDNLRSQSPMQPIRNIFLHPKYDRNSLLNDIAILELENLIKFSPFVRPIYLRSREPRPGELGVASGWGITENDKPSTVLRAAKLTVISKQACADSVASIIGYDRFCSKEAGKATCVHDSGSPFVIGHSQVGVTSMQSGLETTNCGHLGTVYTNVAYFKDFIDSTTENKAHWSST